MADNNFNLEDILPLLISRQKQQAAEKASGDVAGLAGKTLAPNLYDLLTQPRPAPAQPIPNAAGKVPPQDCMDPRMAPALRDVGALAAGGAIGRVAAPLAGEAAGLAGRVAAPSLDSSGAMRAIGGMAGMAPPDTAQAARLSYEQKQQLEFQRRQAETQAAAEQSRIQGQTQAQIESDKTKAEAQRQLEAQKQTDLATALKKEREQPFREKYSNIANALPWAGVAASYALPALAGAAGRSKLQSFVNDWQDAAKEASSKVLGKSKTAAALATNKLRDFEEKWPDMQARYKPGIGQTVAAAGIPVEGVALPTEYDALTQDPNSPSKPTLKDWADIAQSRGIAAGLGGFGAAKLGAASGSPVRPYIGGQGIVNTYNQRYPMTPKQLAIAQALKQLPGPK